MNTLETAMMEYLKGQRAKHAANWSIFVERQIGVAEHIDFMETLEKELEQIAKYDELIATLKSLTK
ncbi:hypothetical protein [Vibrio sp.]|uniref:hypothetical protein n=1 Tax=Vibrio sp. TaxID=678 RepID=UPI00311FED0E